MANKPDNKPSVQLEGPHGVPDTASEKVAGILSRVRGLAWSNRGIFGKILTVLIAVLMVSVPADILSKGKVWDNTGATVAHFLGLPSGPAEFKQLELEKAFASAAADEREATECSERAETAKSNLTKSLNKLKELAAGDVLKYELVIDKRAPDLAPEVTAGRLNNNRIEELAKKWYNVAEKSESSRATEIAKTIHGKRVLLDESMTDAVTSIKAGEFVSSTLKSPPDVLTKK